MTPESLAKKNSEDGHQAALFCWATLERNTYPELKWMFAIPNGGNRDARQGARLKMTGTKAGVWDIMLPIPIKLPHDELTGHFVHYHGLFIEMKKPKTRGQSAGTLQGNQKDFQKHADFFNYGTVVCYTWEEARDAIISYLTFVPEEQRQRYREATKK